MIGSQLSGRYRVLREIGRGGVGVVYQAHDPLLDRDVAVKLLDPEAMSTKAAQRFEREARAIAKMDHPSIMQVFDIGHHDRAMFFVMPLARGSSLRTILADGPLEARDLVPLAIHVADALLYSHGSGIIHRDIKPENIMISGHGAESRLIVTDFGLAVSEGGEERLTQSGTIVGTAAYLAPEQIRDRDVDARTDLFALGVVMYEALTGAAPFDSPIPVVLDQILHVTPPPPHLRRSSIDRELSRIVMWCMEKDPDRRPQNASQLLNALRRYETRAGGEATPSDSETTLPRLIGRSKEKETIERLLEMARAGEAHLLLITGEAGIGKTRLVEELDQICTTRNISFLEARFAGGHEGTPYQPFCELLQTWFQSTPPEQYLDAFADCAADLVSLFPILREIEPIRQLVLSASKPAGKEKQELFELLAGAISRIGRGHLLVLALEELHFSGVSAELLQYLVSRLAPVPLLMVGTCRPSELPRKHPLHALLDEATRGVRVHLLALEPLDATEHRQLLRQVLGAGTVAATSNERIFNVTEGNPFFVQELARALVESKKLTFDGAEWHLSEETELDAEALPPTIQLAVERRIEALAPEARAVLETASVIGRTFEAGDVEELMDARDLDVQVEKLTAEGYLREERGKRGEHFSFSSALIREVAYAGVPRRRRRSLHRKYAELVEQRNAGRTEKVLYDLLHHYAEADDAEKVTHYGLQYARKSLAAFSALEALRATRLVIDFLESDGDGSGAETEARTLAARAHRLNGSVDSALRELEIVAGSGDPAAALSASAEAAEAAWEARRIEDSSRWVERGLQSGGTDAGSTRKLLAIAANLANMRGDVAAAIELFARADALEERQSGPAILAGRGGVIRVPIAGDLLSLDPALSFTVAHTETLSIVYETLTRETDAARIAPWLAEIVQADANGRRFHLDLRDVRFHNGRPLTAADVRYSFERLLRNTAAESRWMLSSIDGARAFGEGTADRIEGLRILNDRRLVLELSEPLSFFPALLAFMSAAIVPAGLSEFSGNWRDGCAGTGPFRVADFQAGGELRLEASPHYWREGFPRADGVVFTFGLSPTEIARGLRDGTYDVGWDLLPEDLEELRRDPRFIRGFRTAPRLSTYYIAFNIHQGPLQDEALRREIAGALDVPKLVSALGRIAMPARGFIPPGLLGYEPVRRRLARGGESAHSSRLSLQAMLNSAYQGPYAGFAARLFDALSAIGVDVSVIESKSEYVTNQAEALASAQILFTRWLADYPDAHDFASLLHSRTGLVGRLCGTPDIDRLIERGAREGNPETRHEIYRQIEDILADRALVLPLFHEQSYRFARPEIQDFAINYFSPVVAYERIWVG